MKSIEEYEQMARKCENCGASDVWDRELAIDADGNITTPPAAVRFTTSIHCLNCRHDQALGPSNDTPEALVELRAAELIAEFTSRRANCVEFRMSDGAWTDEEMEGWDAHRRNESTMWPVDPAGWLAHAIWTHGEPCSHRDNYGSLFIDGNCMTCGQPSAAIASHDREQAASVEKEP